MLRRPTSSSGEVGSGNTSGGLAAAVEDQESEILCRARPQVINSSVRRRGKFREDLKADQMRRALPRRKCGGDGVVTRPRRRDAVFMIIESLRVTASVRAGLFKQFDESRDRWGCAVKCVTLDALLSLA